MHPTTSCCETVVLRQVSSDPRIRELLAQLLAFLDDGDLPTSIISRAVADRPGFPQR